MLDERSGEFAILKILQRRSYSMVKRKIMDVVTKGELKILSDAIMNLLDDGGGVG